MPQISRIDPHNQTQTLRRLSDLASALDPGITVTVPLAKLTAGGTNGSLTIIKGIITAITNPT
jgi:hypothetical protein